MEEALVNTERFEELRLTFQNDSESRLDAIIRDFYADTEAGLRAMQSALESGNGPEVRRLAHRIKGASLIVCADKLAATCRLLEAAAHAENRPKMAALISGFPVLVKETARAHNALMG